VTDLRTWLSTEAAELEQRLRRQVLDLVPFERRDEQPGGGNSVTWGLFHVATHVDLALAVLGTPRAEGPADDRRAWGGLEEAEAPWSSDLDPAGVEVHLLASVEATRAWLATSPLELLDGVPDAGAALLGAGVDPDRFAWLFAQWSQQAGSFFVRWPLLGHVGNHIGELVAVRNRLGLSPF